MQGWRRTAVDLFLMAAIGIILALIAPFGTDAQPPALRLPSWVAFMVAGYFIFRPVSMVGDMVATGTRVPRWLAVPMVALVAALPLAALIAFALGGMRADPFWFGDRFLTLYLQVAALGVVIHLLMMAIFADPRPSPAAEPERPEPGEPEPHHLEPAPFLRRLPPSIGRDLLCLEMQDHYVEAHTREGSALLLMRFRDAVAELGGAGMQVHRSWWVARDAVEGLENDGRRTMVRLRGGRRIPVSRALLSEVRAALSGQTRA